jgi:hypothetical protein
VLGDVAQDVADVADCAVSEEEELPGVASDDGLTDDILNGSEDLRSAHVRVHLAYLLDCVFDLCLGVAGAVLKQILVVAAEAEDVEVAVLGQAADEDLQRSLGVIDSHPAHRPASVEEEDVLSLVDVQLDLELLAAEQLLVGVVDAQVAVLGDEGNGRSGVVV